MKLLMTQKGIFHTKTKKKDLEKILEDSSGDDEFKTMAQAELEDLKLQNELIEKKTKVIFIAKR